MTFFWTLLLVTIAACVSAGPAWAYVGPGAGITLIGSTVGLLIAIVTALGMIMLWPLRALLKRRTAPRPEVQGEATCERTDGR